MYCRALLRIRNLLETRFRHVSLEDQDRALEEKVAERTKELSERLESMTKGTRHQVFVSDATHDLASRADALVEVGELEVRGRSAPMRVWTLNATEGTDP